MRAFSVNKYDKGESYLFDEIDMSSYLAENKSEADEQKSASSFNDIGADMD